jgi:hypothetical protein
MRTPVNLDTDLLAEAARLTAGPSTGGWRPSPPSSG